MALPLLVAGTRARVRSPYVTRTLECLATKRTRSTTIERTHDLVGP